MVTAADLQPQPAAGVTTFADAVQAILSGRTYINVHTQQNPNGEIRGQLGPISLRAVLSGDNEVPPVTSPAAGNADVVLNGLQSQVQVVLTSDKNVLQHIVVARPAGGGIILRCTARPTFVFFRRVVTAPSDAAGISFSVPSTPS